MYCNLIFLSYILTYNIPSSADAIAEIYAWTTEHNKDDNEDDSDINECGTIVLSQTYAVVLDCCMKLQCSLEAKGASDDVFHSMSLIRRKVCGEEGFFQSSEKLKLFLLTCQW